MRGPAGISVAEAAAILGISPQRVRALIQDQQLEASKVGHVWLISPESSEHQLRPRPRSGRPFDQKNAWALLLMESDDPVLQQRVAAWVSPWMRWYLANQAKREDWLSLSPRLRRRATLQRLRSHPSDLARLAAEPDVVRTGVSAATDHHLDISASGILEAYVPAKRLPKLAKQYLLAPSDSPNVLLRVVNDPWPFPDEWHAAPPLVAALDLLDSGDQRSVRAATAYLREHGGPDKARDTV